MGHPLVMLAAMTSVFATLLPISMATSTFCPEETLHTIGFGDIVWPSTAPGQSASVLCPGDKPNAVTGFGTRGCQDVRGSPVWQTPALSPCPILAPTARQISGLMQGLLAANKTTTPSIASLVIATDVVGVTLLGEDDALQVSSITAAISLLEVVNVLFVQSRQGSIGQNVSIAAENSLKLVTSMVKLADHISRSLSSTAVSTQDASSLQRLTAVLESAVQNLVLVKEEQPLSITTASVSVAAICPSTITQPYTAVLQNTAGGHTGFKSLSVRRGELANNESDLTSFRMPAEALSIASTSMPQQANQKDGDCQQPKIFFLAYTNTSLLQDKDVEHSGKNVGPVVISAKVGTLQSVRLNSSEVRFTLPITGSSKANFSTQCSYWNQVSSGWSSQGCRVRNSTLSHVTCNCNHLTNFAVLVTHIDVEGTTVIKTQSLSTISIVGCSLSMVILAMSIFVGLFFSGFCRRLHCKLMTLLSASLLLTLVLFLITATSHRSLSLVQCRSLGVLQHTALLTAFAWLMLLAIHVYRHLVIAFVSDNSFLKIFGCLAVFIPLCITGLTAGLSNFKAYDPAHMCWFSKHTYFYTSLVAPIAFALLCNLAVLVLVMGRLKAKTTAMLDMPALKMIRITCLLSLLVALTWVFGALLAVKNIDALQYVFAVLVALQGFAVFIVNILTAPTLQKTGRRSASSTTIIPPVPAGRTDSMTSHVSLSKIRSLSMDSAIDDWSGSTPRSCTSTFVSTAQPVAKYLLTRQPSVNVPETLDSISPPRTVIESLELQDKTVFTIIPASVSPITHEAKEEFMANFSSPHSPEHSFSLSREDDIYRSISEEMHPVTRDVEVLSTCESIDPRLDAVCTRMHRNSNGGESVGNSAASSPRLGVHDRLMHHETHGNLLSPNTRFASKSPDTISLRSQSGDDFIDPSALAQLQRQAAESQEAKVLASKCPAVLPPPKQKKVQLAESGRTKSVEQKLFNISSVGHEIDL